MTGTVIDALVVELGLDPTKFTKAQQDAIASFKKTQEAAHKTAVDIESQFQRATEVFSTLRNQVIGLYALFTTGRGLKEFVEDITTTDAEVGRLARTMDVATGTLAAWRGAAQLVGGTAGAITQSMQGLMQQFQQFSLTGESSVIPYFRTLGIALSDSRGKLRPMGDILLDLSEKFSKMDPARALAFGQALGLDQGTINLLIQGRAAVKGMLDEQERLGHVNEADAKAAQERQKAWEEFTLTATQLGRQILTVITPALVTLAKGLTAITVWANAHPKTLQAIFYGITAAVITLTVALGVLAAAAIATAGAFGWIIAGVGLVAAGWTYLITTIHSLKDVWDLLVYAFQHSPFQLLVDGFGLILKAGQSLVGVLHNLLNAWHALWGGVKGSTGATTSPASPGKQAAATGGSKSGSEGDIQRLMAMGWSRAQAAGIAANIQRESGGNPNAVGDNGKAFGLAQWHPDRQAAFAKWAGHDIRSATREEQLGFINYELRSGNERAAGRALAGATNASSAAAIVSRLYERPAAANAEASTRSAMALALLQAPAGVAALGAQGAAASAYNTTNNRTSSSTATTDVKIGEINIKTNATDAPGIAKEIGPSIQRVSFGQQASYGAN